MDQVNNQLPNFADKAEALHYFPMWRTWFSLHGLCKLPWNDILPADNAQTDEPAKVLEHVENYTWLYEGVTGRSVSADDLIQQSERVYNFQRIFNLKMGFGTREHDYPPYRAVGPVTMDEYESRAGYYDRQLQQDIGVYQADLTIEKKMTRLRQYREARYEQLLDAVYARRGWDENGIPTLQTLRRLGIDLPEAINLIQRS
jgi:aldehyde:ferredoxin oxidoreductase